MSYGGPHAAYFAVKDEFKRQMPGRIIGLSIDSVGNKAYRLALQTREQHIRREKATSNICTAQALLAIMAGMYAVYHGPQGVKNIAGNIHYLTAVLNEGLKKLGYKQLNEMYFDTLLIETKPEVVYKIRQAAEDKKINLCYVDNSLISIAVGEDAAPKDIETILEIFAQGAGTKLLPFSEIQSAATSPISDDMLRKDAILTSEVFNRYYSETDLMRYIKSLEKKDLSLANAMIPLGSCTMKLNPAAAMLPITWPEFADIHPFAPAEQAMGYKEMIAGLEKDLCTITGFAAVSLQPNSGAAGEYSGLMVIRQYHLSRGDNHRNIVLIPASAHGTNPASAVMAGNQVVVVSCASNGNIDIDDLRKKAEQYKDNLAALMVTYPSTHGVFEEEIVDICKIIHEFGGLVYMDGANMNAQVGLTSPAEIGADVCHLNLHKTFAIPHGGGGPGVGPIAVKESLVKFLPGHSIVNIDRGASINAVASAPYGSVGVAVISYAYIKMMGEKGLKEATSAAILNANYLRSKLESYYKILYTGSRGMVAHELIFDMTEFKTSAGIDVEDIAKRLMDYGFHAPTVSFPVHNTLMVEPTESEPLGELDRFCEAMIMIRQEMQDIIDGKSDKNDNPLRNAPHTMIAVAADLWEHSYSRQQAAFPTNSTRNNKFWPAVGRVNNAYGDRNLVCR
jgi:glycine dehydrogenase